MPDRVQEPDGAGAKEKIRCRDGARKSLQNGRVARVIQEHRHAEDDQQETGDESGERERHWRKTLKGGRRKQAARQRSRRFRRAALTVPPPRAPARHTAYSPWLARSST